MDECAHHYQATLTIVLRDNGSCHTAKSLVMPENFVWLVLPPYSPELTPIERLWHEVKAQVAWVLTAALAELEDHVARVITRDSQAASQTLTS